MHISQIVTLLLLLLIVLGCANFVLLKLLYSAFGQANAFFVDQAINLLYVIIGGLILIPRILMGKITPEMRRYPQWKFMALASLDGLGTFMTAMGASYTPGQLQPLLNQTLIPLTMISSYFLLRQRYKNWAIVGSILIVAGSVVSVVPQVIGGVSGVKMLKWYAVIFYACSNIPMALSAVYKQIGLAHANLDIWYLVQMVSIYQLLLSFILVPLLALPGFGSDTGMPMSLIPSLLIDGLLCCVGKSPGCTGTLPLWLLLVYCLVNFGYNGVGLGVTKHTSAVLRSMSYALLLPLSTLAFALPFMGQFRETVSVFTAIGLVLALAGFALYRHFAVDLRQDQKEMKDPLLHTGQSRDRLMSAPDTFQERVIGMGIAFREVDSDLDSSDGFCPQTPNTALTDYESLYKDYHVA